MDTKKYHESFGVAYPFIPWCGIPESAIPCSKHPNLLLAEDLHFNNRVRCISFAELELQHLPCSITPSPPRSSWIWFQSDFTRTPNVGFWVMAHYLSKSVLFRLPIVQIQKLSTYG